jgi:peroxiredoxin
MVLMNDNSKVLHIGDPMPPFRLPATAGNNVDSEKLEGQIIVVVFTCNHCPYAQAYESRMVQLQNDYQPKGVTLIAINSNDETNYPEDSFPNMVKRAKEKGFNFPYLRDETQETARQYGAICTPHIFVFDQNMTLQYKGRIDDSRYPEQVKVHDLRNALDAMLANNKPPVQETRPFGCSIKWKQ